MNVELTAEARATATLEASVDRGANAARINALAVVFSAALGVGVNMGASLGSVPWGIVSGLLAAPLTVGFFAVVYRVPPVRRRMMAAMHWVTRE